MQIRTDKDGKIRFRIEENCDGTFAIVEGTGDNKLYRSPYSTREEARAREQGICKFFEVECIEEEQA